MDLVVTYQPTSSLTPYVRNARTHSSAQINMIAASIREFGFSNPILVGADGVVIAGHGRLDAAKKLGLELVPTIVLSQLSDEQRRALVLADNKIALGSGWDPDLLASELSDLHDAGFDMELTGFSDQELGELIKPHPSGGLTHPDEAPPVAETVVCSIGETWILGSHRVTCGDCTDSVILSAAVGSEPVDVVWTDPPYNVAYGGKAEMLGRYDKGHRNTSRILNDDLPASEFLALLEAAFAACFSRMRPGAAIYVAHSETEGINFRGAFQKAGFKLSSCLIWRKNALVLGRADYQWIHEPILYGWKPGAAHRWYGGRKQVSVQDLGDGSPFVPLPDGRWQITVHDTVMVVSGEALVQELVPSVLHEEKPRRSDLHPTMKPVALVEKMLSCSARPGDQVLDPFGGSGSTLIAAERLGMRARLVELDPRYCDVIIRRWQDYTGQGAIRELDQRRFDHARA